ncbi:MAG: histidine kinase [Hydrogenoanaerobacterium sp.]
MVEIIDNTVQLAVTTGCAVWAGVLGFHYKSHRYSLLACFYATFALGLLYWLLFLILKSYTPKLFYVSDLSWIASFLFLLLLSFSIIKDEERGYRPFAAFAVSFVLLLLTVKICSFGDYGNTLIWCLLLTVCGYLSTRGLLYARKQSGNNRQMQYLHITILFIVFTEFILWLTSCYFKGDTLKNPYYWCDFALTIGLFALMPAMKKAVDK